jgi:hypothetical protein
VRIEIANPSAPELYDTESPWWGVRDKADNTLVAIFWGRSDANRCQENWGASAEVVELRITEDDE